MARKRGDVGMARGGEGERGVGRWLGWLAGQEKGEVHFRPQ